MSRLLLAPALLLWAPADFQLVELTARRSQVQVIERGMQIFQGLAA